jgi:superoxide reductase
MARIQKFYVCGHCGNVVGLIHDAGVPMLCCGEKMREAVPNTSDGAREKHLPVVTGGGGVLTVGVGSAAHPMTEAHNIQWVYLQTKGGGQRKTLAPEQAPTVKFALADDEAVAAFAYCNLHGLWKTEL